MPEDAFLSMMKGIVDKWIDVPQTVTINGNDSTLRPSIISLNYLERDSSLTQIQDGAVVEPHGQRDVQGTGYSIGVLVGNAEQGHGASRIGRSDLPRDNRVVRKRMDYSMDSALKNALSDYMSCIQNSIVEVNDSKFTNISDDPVDVYVQEQPEKSLIQDALVSRVVEWSREVSDLDHITESGGAIMLSNQVHRFVDSQGRKIREYSQLGNIILRVEVMHDDKFITQLFENIHLTSDFDYSLKELDARLEELLTYSGELRSATTPTSDQYPVIFSGKAVGTLFHEALGGHNLSGRYIKEGTSTTFKDQLNSQIIPSFLTLIDDPQKPGAYGFYMFDMEGIRGQKTVLVEDGVLMNYLLDRDSARYFETESNGRSRMDWVTTEADEESDTPGEIISTVPEPRASNLELISSKYVPDEGLIELLKEYCIKTGREFGLYIETHQGQVNIQSSEFLLNPTRAWKIYTDGRTEPVINFFVFGKPYELLRQIYITGDTPEICTGVCGASSGWIATQEIAPAAFIPEVTIQAYSRIKGTERLLPKSQR